MKKRCFSILMALCMVLTLAVPAVAVEDTVDTLPAETPVTQETKGQEPPEPSETTETAPSTLPADVDEGDAGDPSSDEEEPVLPEEDTPAGVAQIGEQTYGTLDKAVEAAVEGATIVLLQDCELTKGFNKTLTFTGNGKITINKQLTSNGEAWMCFGLYDPSRVLTFDGAGVEVEWNSDGTTPWLMLSLSGTLNVTNGASLTFQFDSKTTGARNAIYMNEGSQINVTNGATLKILGVGTEGNAGQGIQLNKAGTACVNVTGNSTFLIDGTNRGYVNSPTICVGDSTFTVQNCTSNASNGGQFTAINSSITYQNNQGHGLSAGDVTIQNSTLNCNKNAYYGITYSGNMTMDATSAINANENGHGYTGGGLRAYGTSTVEAGAEINILDNKRNGMENYGTFTMEDGVKFTATGNHEPSTNGGGIYNGRTLTLPANAIVMNNYAEQTGGGICNAGTATIPGSVKLYNNHAGDAGDDIYNRDSATITFGPVGTDWYLDGDPDCYHGIDGWYDDSSDTRWEAHAASEEENHIEKFEGTADREGRFTITGLKALKAAHGTLDDGETTIFIQPANIAIYTGGEGYESVVEGTREELDGQQSQGLPEPGYYITLPDWVNALIKNNDNTISLDENGAADLSDILSFSYNFNGETRRWTLKRYDNDGKSTAYGQYVYRLIPGTGQYNVRLQFSDGEETILSDVFTPALDQLYKEYTMTIYAGALEQQEVQATITPDEVTDPFDVEVVPGTLTIRGVTEDVETPLLNGGPSDNGFAAKVPQNTQYFINGSQIGINDASGIALLVDELVEGDSPIITNAVYHALNEKTLDTLLEEKGVVLSNPRYDYAYMNLVDTNNGNVYVQADQPVTVTWPYPAGTDAAAPGSRRRHLIGQAAVSPDAHTPPGNDGVVIHHLGRQTGGGLHLFRHIQLYRVGAGPHHAAAGIGGGRQHTVPGHRIGDFLRQGQGRHPCHPCLPGFPAHRAMGTAYLVVDLVGKARIRPLHGNGSALPQGHVPGLESGGPWDHRQRHGLGYRQRRRRPLGGKAAVPRCGQGRAAAAVRPVIHRHRPAPQLVPALLLVPVRVIHGFPLQNIPAAVGRLVVRLPRPVVDIQRQGQGRPVFRRVLAYGIIQPQPPPGGGHRPVNTRHLTLRSTGRPAPKPW